MASSASGDTAKEIKAQVKQARELMNQKDHSGALKLCEVMGVFFSYSLSSIYIFLCYRQLLRKIKHAI